jgi:glycosyltransferase involved in cell wall biosynthesis
MDDVPECRTLPDMDAPRMSIVLPAYQVAAYVGTAIASVINQSRSDWELIVIDDGSEDDLAAVVQPYLRDPRISFHRFGNGGLAVARNRGIALARGEFVALLDGDDLYEPTYLERMAAPLEADPDIAFVSCDALMFGIAEREGHRYSQHERQVPPITIERVLNRDFNVFGLCMIRADVLRSVGGYAEDLRSAEDFDLWVRILATGAKGSYVNQPLVRYRRRAGSLSTATEAMHRNLATVYARAMRLVEGSPAEAICRQRLMRQLEAIDLL